MKTLLAGLLVLVAGSVSGAQLENYPPTTPVQAVKIYKEGLVLDEIVCRADLRSSYVCDLIGLPDGTGRLVMFNNQNEVVKIYSVDRNGEKKLLWESHRI